MLAEVADRDSLREGALDEHSRRVRQDDLAAVRRRSNPSCPMDVESGVIVAAEASVPGV